MADERDEWIYDFIHSTSFNRRCQVIKKISRRYTTERMPLKNGEGIHEKFVGAGGIPVLLRFIKNQNLKTATGRGGIMDALYFATSLCREDKDGNILKIFYENGAVNDVISSHISSSRIKPKLLTGDYLLLLTVLGAYEPARNEILSPQSLVIIYDHLTKVPKDYGENDMERALAFIENEVKRNQKAREQLAKAGCVGKLVKAAKLVVKQLDKGYRVESYIESIVLCLSHIMTENISTVPEAEKEGLPGILCKILPTNFYCAMVSFRPCVIILMYVMWDTASMQKMRRDKKFTKCEAAIKQFHKKYTTLGYGRIEEGLRCKPYAARLVEKFQT